MVDCVPEWMFSDAAVVSVEDAVDDVTVEVGSGSAGADVVGVEDVISCATWTVVVVSTGASGVACSVAPEVPAVTVELSGVTVLASGL